MLTDATTSEGLAFTCGYDETAVSGVSFWCHCWLLPRPAWDFRPTSLFLSFLLLLLLFLFVLHSKPHFAVIKIQVTDGYIHADCARGAD